MPSSAGKRERERQKLEKAQAKAERRAAQRAVEPDPDDGSHPRSESELIEDLAALQRAFEAGEVSQEDFDERRGRLQAEFGRLSG
jgi:hypothetical protein